MQLEQTALALRDSHGIDAVTSADLEPSLLGFDLVHLFGLVRPQEVWVQARNAVRHGVPVVLSTVYCDVWEFERNARGGALGWLARHSNRDLVEGMKASARGVVSREWSSGSAALLTKGFTAMQRDIVRTTSVFLPNSYSEWARIKKDLNLRVPEERMVVVPNAASGPPPKAEIEAAKGTLPISDLRGCVLCVGRIEGRKNQLNLIRAVGGTEFTLVLAGRPAAHQPQYVRAVSAAASRHSNIHVLGPVSEAQKWALYDLARVHVLPSWIETTGLVSLEAALMDCAIAVSPDGDTSEYFGDYAEYCEPSDTSSILAAIRRAYDRGPQDVLRDDVTTRLTWDAAAAASIVGYERALAMSGRRRRSNA